MVNKYTWKNGGGDYIKWANILSGLRFHFEVEQVVHGQHSPKLIGKAYIPSREEIQAIDAIDNDSIPYDALEENQLVTGEWFQTSFYVPTAFQTRLETLLGAEDWRNRLIGLTLDVTYNGMEKSPRGGADFHSFFVYLTEEEEEEQHRL